jgi:antitoxin component of MazEF toxin-antitoxin module
MIMTAIQQQENDDVNVAETEEQKICVTGITAEEWFHKLGGMLAEHFGDEIKDDLNGSLAEFGMKPLP